MEILKKQAAISYGRMLLLALGLIFIGAAAAEAPSFVLDLYFLHQARMNNEASIAVQRATQAYQQQQQSKPNVIDQSQVHPGPPDPSDPTKPSKPPAN